MNARDKTPAAKVDVYEEEVDVPRSRHFQVESERPMALRTAPSQAGV
jgi:hypothetical protein